MEKNETHPLIRKKFGMLRHWCLWKKAWDEAEHAEQLMGLLHVAFDMETASHEETLERFRFLLEVADGFAAYDELKKQDDYPSFGVTYGRLEPTGIISEPNQFRRTVARKAMQVLCDRALRFEPSKGCQTAWLFVLPKVFEKLLWFFDDADRRAYGHNLSDRDDGRLETALRAFARELVSNGWPLRPDAFDRSTWHEVGSVSAMFQAARPRFVRMLHRMDALDLLVDRDKRWRDMGDAEMAVLRQAATRRSSRSALSGEYASLDEALCDCSKAAQVLLTVEAHLRVDARRQRILEAERKRNDAEDELEAARK